MTLREHDNADRGDRAHEDHWVDRGDADYEAAVSDRLAADLRALTQHDVAVGDAVDKRVMAEAGQRLRGAAAHHRRLRWARWVGGAAAAVLVLGVAMWVYVVEFGEGQADRVGSVAVDRGQVDGAATVMDVTKDGTVNILDAFALSRRLRDMEADRLPPRYDLTGDGEVSEADVEHLAMRVVDLGIEEGGL
jgi:hypothetical protein